MPIDGRVDAPSGPAANELSDWIEAEIVLSVGSDHVTRGEIRAALLDEPDDPAEPDEPVEDARLEARTRDESRVDTLFGEVERRRDLAPRVYPYEVREERIVRSGCAGEHTYDLLHWLSLSGTPVRVDRRTAEVERAFDDICKAALTAYMGKGSDSALYAQRYAEDDADEDSAVRPKSFPVAIKWLRKKLAVEGPYLPLRELPEPEEVDYLPARTYNDGGVDVIVWRPFFRDERTGFPVLLAQTTVQTEWRKKTLDVSLDLWRNWVHFGGHLNKCLAIPFAVPPKKWWWHDRNTLAGLIFDRFRLCQSLNELDDEGLAELVSAPTREWLIQEHAWYGVPREDRA